MCSLKTEYYEISNRFSKNCRELQSNVCMDILTTTTIKAYIAEFPCINRRRNPGNIWWYSRSSPTKTSYQYSNVERLFQVIPGKLKNSSHWHCHHRVFPNEESFINEQRGDGYFFRQQQTLFCSYILFIVVYMRAYKMEIAPPLFLFTSCPMRKYSRRRRTSKDTKACR